MLCQDNFAIKENLVSSFYESFIRSYDLSGRYTREYHPFILEKTEQSFTQLEQSLSQDGLTIDGHMLVIGYQEDAVLPYMTKWSRIALRDEVVVNTHVGVTPPARNIFGYMTGFLLKDVQWLERYWFGKKEPFVSHTHEIDLFSDNAVIFQKHAFGKDFDAIIKVRDRIEKALYEQDIKEILNELIIFWSAMYERASKTGSQETVSTQDIIFSIAYGRALLHKNTKLKKLFIGPDITYPIEVLSCQEESATVHAQKFIRTLQENLKPIDDQETVYMFCSFVDGVGKSTLLNNIKNWGKYGEDFSKYERCDNSSSQEATLFKLKDKVFIADLPAQISHYTIKPDGQVFVNINTVKELNAEFKQELIAFVREHKQELIKNFNDIIKNLQIDKALYSYTSFLEQYAHNCLIFNNIHPSWIAFEYKNYCCLFNSNNIEDIRVLVSLGNAHSIGLKVVDPEHMLFNKGLSLPMKYTNFLDDLKYKLHNASIKRVVFIDFLSMYPRSSRENIRVNFILQYLKKVFGSHYNLQHSFYQHRIYPEQEICHLLYNLLNSASETLVLETAIRWALYNLLQKGIETQVTALQGAELEQVLKAQVETLLVKYTNEIKQESYKRLLPERDIYYQNYCFDRIYQTLVQFSVQSLVDFSKVLISFFGYHIQHPYFAQLWSGMNEKLVVTDQTKIQKEAYLADGTKVEILHVFHKDVRNEEDLKEVIKLLRAQWYATIENLLFVVMQDTAYTSTKISSYVPPLAVALGEDDYVYVYQKSLPLIDATHVKLQTPAKYHVIDQPLKLRHWGIFSDKPHCVEWYNTGTSYALFAYGYYPYKSPKNMLTQLLEHYKQLVLQEGKSNWCISTAQLSKLLVEKNMLSKIKEEIDAQIKEKTEIISANDPRRVGIQLWARMIATLDMILKDTRTEICISRNNAHDFVAALQLLETITLPLYFNMRCDTPLFTNYQEVQPVIAIE